MMMSPHPPGMEVPPRHLIQSEINAVTSAIRKHVRNASSSSFLGGNSNASGVGPVAGGSSTASLLRNAVASASATLQHTSINGSQHTPLSSSTSGSLRLAQGGKTKEGHGIAPLLSSTINSSKQGYPDSRRDEGIGSLLNGFTVLRAQLREASGELSLKARRIFPTDFAKLRQTLNHFLLLTSSRHFCESYFRLEPLDQSPQLPYKQSIDYSSIKLSSFLLTLYLKARPPLVILLIHTQFK